MAKSEEIKNKTDLTLLPDFFSFLFFLTAGKYQNILNGKYLYLKSYKL